MKKNGLQIGQHSNNDQETTIFPVSGTGIIYGSGNPIPGNKDRNIGGTQLVLITINF
jgi:hypothetical protein